MSKPLRVLIIENSEEDARLLLKHLQQGDYAPAYERVDNASSLSTALDHKEWDIVISDYALPRLSALEVLRLIKAKNLDLPMVIISDKTSDTVAAGISHNGMHNFVSRDNLCQLLPCIQRTALGCDITEQKLRQPEKRYLDMLESMFEGVQVIGFDWRYKYINEAAARHARQTSGEILGHTMMEIYSGIENTLMFTHLWHCMYERKPLRMENEFTFPDGSKGWFELSIEPVPEGVLVLSMDISERKRALDRIIYLDKVLLLIRNINQLIVKTDNETELLQKTCRQLVNGHHYLLAWIGFVQEGSYDVLPLAQAGFQDGYLSSIKVSWDDSEHGCWPTGTAIKTGQPAIMQDIINDQSYGPWREEALKRGYQSSAALPLIVSKKVIGALNVYSAYPYFLDAEIDLLVELAGDVSLGIEKIRQREEQKHSEATLRQSETTFRQFFENAPVYCYMISPEGIILDVNKAALEALGYQEEELVGLRREVLYDPECQGKLRQLESRWSRTGILLDEEMVILTKAGKKRNVLLSVGAIRDENNKIISSISMLRDVTALKQAERNLERAVKEWRTTFDSITDLVSIHDKDFKLQRVNKAFADTLGMSPAELIGKPCYEILHGADKPIPNCPHKLALRTCKPHVAEYFEPHLGVHLEVSVSPLFDGKGEIMGTVHIAKDVSERRKMREQLIVTDRLAAVGELASGIAHELNNPLTGIIGFSDLLMEKELSPDIKEDLKTINREAKRTAGVVRNLLAFARKQPLERQPVDINETIQKVLELRAYEHKVQNIVVKTEFAADLPKVLASSFDLQQVFINGEYFMLESHKKGTLTIATERSYDTVRISFVDDGPGIAKEVLAHVFDPFFTTKEVGKGTGLGLSICHGVVTAHGGRISVESESGKGAVFTVELPIGGNDDTGDAK